MTTETPTCGGCIRRSVTLPMPMPFTFRSGNRTETSTSILLLVTMTITACHQADHRFPTQRQPSPAEIGASSGSCSNEDNPIFSRNSGESHQQRGTRLFLNPLFTYQSSHDQRPNHPVGIDSSDRRDLRTRDRLPVRDDRQRLQRRLRQARGLPVGHERRHHRFEHPHDWRTATPRAVRRSSEPPGGATGGVRTVIVRVAVSPAPRSPAPRPPPAPAPDRRPAGADRRPSAPPPDMPAGRRGIRRRRSPRIRGAPAPTVRSF